MGSYAGVHSRSYGLVGRKGSSVTFTKVSTTYTAETDTTSTSTSTVTGVAVRDGGKGRRADGTVTADGMTLFFVPSTYGESPETDSICEWAGVKYTVTRVTDVAPDGTPIGSYVELA